MAPWWTGTCVGGTRLSSEGTNAIPHLVWTLTPTSPSFTSCRSPVLLVSILSSVSSVQSVQFSSVQFSCFPFSFSLLVFFNKKCKSNELFIKINLINHALPDNYSDVIEDLKLSLTSSLDAGQPCFYLSCFILDLLSHNLTFNFAINKTTSFTKLYSNTK